MTRAGWPGLAHAASWEAGSGNPGLPGCEHPALARGARSRGVLGLGLSKLVTQRRRRAGADSPGRGDSPVASVGSTVVLLEHHICLPSLPHKPVSSSLIFPPAPRTWPASSRAGPIATIAAPTGRPPGSSPSALTSSVRGRADPGGGADPGGRADPGAASEPGVQALRSRVGAAASCARGSELKSFGCFYYCRRPGNRD